MIDPKELRYSYRLKNKVTRQTLTNFEDQASKPLMQPRPMKKGRTKIMPDAQEGSTNFTDLPLDIMHEVDS